MNSLIHYLDWDGILSLVCSYLFHAGEGRVNRCFFPPSEEKSQGPESQYVWLCMPSGVYFKLFNEITMVKHLQKVSEWVCLT